jgi:ribose 5-phosphate isomerase B
MRPRRIHLKNISHDFLNEKGYEVNDFGAYKLDNSDDYPNFVIPLAKAVALKEVVHGIAICGSGVGASFSANKISEARAALIQDHFSAHQGVEDDDKNLLCIKYRKDCRTPIKTYFEISVDCFINL